MSFYLKKPTKTLTLMDWSLLYKTAEQTLWSEISSKALNSSPVSVCRTVLDCDIWIARSSLNYNFHTKFPCMFSPPGSLQYRNVCRYFFLALWQHLVIQVTYNNNISNLHLYFQPCLLKKLEQDGICPLRNSKILQQNSW